MCPICGAELEVSMGEAHCSNPECGWHYSIEDVT